MSHISRQRAVARIIDRKLGRGTTDNRNGQGKLTGDLSHAQRARIDRRHGTKDFTTWRGLNARRLNSR